MDSLLIDLRSPSDTLEDENMSWNHIDAGNMENADIDFKLSR